MNENESLIQLYKDMAAAQTEDSKRWHKTTIISNIIWAVVFVLVVGGLVFAHFWNESQFEYEDTIERSVITQENNDGNNVYQPGDHATYNEGGE